MCKNDEFNIGKVNFMEYTGRIVGLTSMFALRAGFMSYYSVIQGYQVTVGEWLVTLALFAAAWWMGLQYDKSRYYAKELQNSQNVVRDILEFIDANVWSWDVREQKVVVSAGVERLFGVSRWAFFRDPFVGVASVHPEDRERYQAYLRRLLDGKPSICEFRLFQSDVWIESRGNPIFDAQGNVAKIVGFALDVTQKKRTETEIVQKERQLHLLIHSLPDYVVLKDEDGRWLQANRVALDLLNVPEADYVGKTDEELNVAFPSLVSLPSPARQGWKDVKPVRTEETLTLRDGGVSVFDVLKAPAFDRDGGRKGLLVIGRDMTELKDAEKRRLRSEAKFRTITENASDLIALGDKDGVITYASRSHLAVTGYEPSAFEGTRAGSWIHPADAGRVVRQLEELVTTRTPLQTEYRLLRKDGKEVYLETKVSPLFNEEGALESLVFVSRDVTEQRKSQQLISHMAYHDPLTNLPNRRYLLDRVTAEIDAAEAAGTRFSLLFIDIDRFKNINDTLGHETGDRLLVEIANRLSQCDPASGNVVARIGGDEFMVVLTDGTDAEEAAERILHSFRKPFVVGEHELFISPSIGISVYPDNGNDLTTLMKKADIAMYHVKGSGRNHYQQYSMELDRHLHEKVNLENDLRKALSRSPEQFEVYYQPKVDIRDRRIVGMEALLRWQHPELGLVQPDKFIPIAEEAGLISALGELALRQACKQAAAWSASGRPSVRMSVNLSSKQFRQPNLTSTIADILSECRLEPRCLELEITESAVLENVKEAIAKLIELKAMGIYLSMDDFGTGYSSLGDLKHLPLDILKIDRSFVMQTPHQQRDSAIVKAIVSLSETLEMSVIAEGVETEEQCAFLMGIRCFECQGYLFGRPLPAPDVERAWDEWETAAPPDAGSSAGER